MQSIEEPDARTPIQRLFAAVCDSHLETVRQLIMEHPSLLREELFLGQTWLHIAAGYGATEIVELFICKGLDVNAIRDGGTESPLTSAIDYSQLQTATRLLQLGADPNLGRNLIAAINSDSIALELVKLLVEHGADIHQCYPFGDDHAPPINALSWAIDSGKHDIADYLQSKGAAMPPELRQP